MIALHKARNSLSGVLSRTRSTASLQKSPTFYSQGDLNQISRGHS